MIKLFNIWPPGRNGPRFRDHIFKYIYLNENSCSFYPTYRDIFIKIQLNAQKVRIKSGNGLAPNSRQTISWISVEQDALLNMATLGHNELSDIKVHWSFNTLKGGWLSKKLNILEVYASHKRKVLSCVIKIFSGRSPYIFKDYFIRIKINHHDMRASKRSNDWHACVEKVKWLFHNIEHEHVTRQSEFFRLLYGIDWTNVYYNSVFLNVLISACRNVTCLNMMYKFWWEILIKNWKKNLLHVTLWNFTCL